MIRSSSRREDERPAAFLGGQHSEWSSGRAGGVKVSAAGVREHAQ